MEIAANSVVSFDYTLTNEAGDVLDTSQGQSPMSYLHGHAQIISGLEEAMQGRKTGDAFAVTVAPEQGYGLRQDDLIQSVPRSAFAGVDEIEAGMRFQAQGADGPMIVRIVDLSEDSVTVDGNHELAGATLHFDVAITDVRAATAQELEHGHVHDHGADH